MISKFFQFFFHIKNIIEFMQLPKKRRRLVFYSEGENYWVHLKGLIIGLLANTNVNVCYISSGENDPGLVFEHLHYRTFKIDEGFVRNWLFENIDTEIMVLTMPDLNQYQVKRSKHTVHYIYVQHSLVSLHMVYRKGAFDYYDTIFCSGPHHVKEIRTMEAKYNQPPKNLVEHGYGRLDDIRDEAKKRPNKEKPINALKHVLIAPSWGKKGTIESGVCEKIVDQLIGQGHKVTLRPHPQTVKFSKEKIGSIVNKYKNNPLFTCEGNVAGQDALHDSDIMISDWSGAALDFAFGLNKPVIFIDIPKKINNPEYQELGIEPFESYIRNIVGSITTEASINIVNEKTNFNCNEWVFNIGSSSNVGARYIVKLLGEE
jgi:hypothetical protein